MTENLNWNPVLELSHEDMVRLSEILGGPDNAAMIEEAEFCGETGCPPEELEKWLRNEWTEYDISGVLAGTEQAGKDPVLLVR